MLTLVTGAARSGKSEWAEILAGRSQKPVIYLATAMSDPTDPEWTEKLQKHRDRRSSDWKTIEVPMELAAQIRLTVPDKYLLVDSLGTWIANCLEQDSALWERTLENLIEAAIACPADLTFVAEEVGWGVIPAFSSGRLFRDRLGNLMRQLGSVADRVYLVTGGHAIDLSNLGERLPRC
jgi:adenosylcobinamide kinase / adenosylcobinamide-phosphate guanylyltransferase